MKYVSWFAMFLGIVSVIACSSSNPPADDDSKNSGDTSVPSSDDSDTGEHSGGDSDSDFKFGLNLGIKYELSSEMNLYGEFQIDGLNGLFAGIDVRVF